MQATFRIDHVMLPVEDIDRSIAFYSSLLGMRVLESRSDAKRRIAHVGYGPRGEQATLELVQTLAAASPPSAGGGHFCLCVHGLASLCGQVEKSGGSFDRPLDAAGGAVRRAWIRDPDGHLIELSESGV
ncbi:MAG: VOC family protein [Beijerinckiaceae bacterium]